MTSQVGQFHLGNCWYVAMTSQIGPKMRRRCDNACRLGIPLDGKIKDLIFFDYGLFNKICDKIKYFISKNGITNSEISKLRKQF